MRKGKKKKEMGLQDLKFKTSPRSTYYLLKCASFLIIFFNRVTLLFFLTVLKN
jgi:hypothetical protein